LCSKSSNSFRRCFAAIRSAVSKPSVNRLADHFGFQRSRPSAPSLTAPLPHVSSIGAAARRGLPKTPSHISPTIPIHEAGSSRGFAQSWRNPARTRPNGRMATSTEQGMRFREPSFGWRLRITPLPVSGGAIRRNRCGRGALRPTARASAPRRGRPSIGPRGRARPDAGRRPPSDSGR
jgi:hypothetical protein